LPRYSIGGLILHFARAGCKESIDPVTT